MVTSLEVDTSDGIGVKTKINSQDFKGNIIVIHLVVAEGDVDVDSMEFFVLNQKLLINFGCFLEVRSQEMKSSKGELILNTGYKG